jgi:hypothetical protein
VLTDIVVVPTTYILPVKLNEPPADEWLAYVNALSEICELIVVDGSDPEVFRSVASRCRPTVTHVSPDGDLEGLLNGKVAGVLTGLRRASHEHVVIADDDVRYEEAGLCAVTAALDRAEVVRPQNFFEPLPWHARLDTARTLINRLTGGDWPGTLAVRRSSLHATGGYDGNVMFENLELVRTVTAAGGREHVPLGLYVRRLPPSARHFLSQRVRQAYDELSRPVRMMVWLTILPAIYVLARRRRLGAIGTACVISMVLAEAGRQRARGTTVFPPSASLLAPLWIAERAVSAWLALAARVCLGGIPYRGRLMARSATPMRVLRQRHARGPRPAPRAGAR